jgi:hypothetical protein
MMNLLQGYSALENPYTQASGPFDDDMKQLTHRLKDQFE